MSTLKGRLAPFSLTAIGSLKSKSNSRQLVYRGKKPAFIKSEGAFQFLKDFARQCPVLDPPFMEDVMLEVDVFYPSRRTDLDISLLMDALQGPVLENDRLVKSQVVRWGLDPLDPRVELRIRLTEYGDYAGENLGENKP